MEKQTIIIGGITILLAVILFGALGTYIGDISDDNELYEVEENINYSSDFLPTTLENTLSPVGEGITSETVQVYNSTWLEFDGVDDVLVLEYTQPKNSISFWFKNETDSWTNVINNGENIYVDGVSDSDWNYFPYYISGDYIYFGKFDASTYFNGSIENIIIYQHILNTTELAELYAIGR